MEEWLRVDIQGDGRGHFLAQCEASDQPGVGNTLRFELTFDQTELPPMLAARWTKSSERSLSGAACDQKNSEGPRRLSRGSSLQLAPEAFDFSNLEIREKRATTGSHPANQRPGAPCRQNRASR
jgi:hypothetical protein